MCSGNFLYWESWSINRLLGRRFMSLFLTPDCFIGSYGGSGVSVRFEFMRDFIRYGFQEKIYIGASWQDVFFFFFSLYLYVFSSWFCFSGLINI